MSDRIAPGSTLIRNTLNTRLDGLAAGTAQAALAVNCSEFDDVRLGIQSKPEDAGVLLVSIAGPAGVLPAGAADVAAGAYAQYAKVGTQGPVPA
jgi:hypothetical protein